jgi:endonuclease/exonuclease/phosphatase family metal-dependent hydrolase
MAKETDSGRIVRELRAAPPLGQADLLLLQEVAPKVAAEMATAFGMHVGQGNGTTPGENELAILARAPLTDVRILRLPAYDLGFHTRHRFAIAATAMTPAGPVRVFNAHLDTRINTAERLAQLAPVLDTAATDRVPALIGGDFNSNSFFWLGHVLPVPSFHPQAAAVWNAMTARGFRATLSPGAGTFDYLGMHLDWIWARGVLVGTSAVYPLGFSDHHAVLTRVALTPPQ